MAGGAYKLAQAWVEIVPSMKGVGNQISAVFGDASRKAGAAGGETAGTNYSNGFGKSNGLLGKIRSAFMGSDGVSESGGMTAGQKFVSGFSAKGAALTGAVASLTSKAVSTISSSIGGAVSRIDALNNFPRIMQGLGYSTDDASKSINRVDKGIQGLPTTLDAMAGMVQNLAPITGSLSKATDISLAFNDALLAGGKSTDIQSNAFQQLSQIMSTGMPDVQAWRSIQVAMPGQLDQVAKSLLGPTANSDALRQAMIDGKVSMSDFTDAIVNLDKKGAPGFDSFATQAKSATGGIGTTWTNLQTAITRGVAGIISSIGEGNITNIINGVRDAFQNAINGIQGFIGWLKANPQVLEGLASGFAAVQEAAQWLWNAVIKPIADWLAANPDLASALAAGLSAAAVAIGVVSAAMAILNAVMAANPFVLIIGLIAALVAGLVWFFTQTETGQAIWQGFMSWLQSAWTNISGFFQGLWDGIVGFFRSAGTNVQNAWNAVVSWFQGIPGAIGGFFSGIGGAIGWFFQSAANFVGNIWNNVVGFFAGIPGRILGALGNVGSLLWNAGSSIISGLLDGLKSAWNKVTGFVSGIAGWIADHKGPLSYDARLLVPAGNVMMMGFGNALQKSFRANVVPFVSGVDGQLAGMMSGAGITSSRLSNTQPFAGSEGSARTVNLTNKIDASGISDPQTMAVYLAEQDRKVLAAYGGSI